MPEARWLRTEAIDRQANRFDHIRKLEDAAHLSGGAPNNDTLYSRAWVYLKDEPVILSVPEIRDRYYTMEIVDFMGDNFAYVGVRTTGTESGNYAIVGPGWKRTLPAGVKQLPPSSTPWATILGRTFVNPGEDLKNVFANAGPVQAHAALPVGQAGWKPPVIPAIWEPLDAKADPLAQWKMINRAMVEVPPPPAMGTVPLNCPARHRARAGCRKPGCRHQARAGPSRRRRAKIIAGAFGGGYLQKQVNGWNYPPPATGRPTPSGDWLSVPFRCSRASWPTTPKRRFI